MTDKHSIQKGTDYILKNKLPIINYAVESNNNPLKIFNQYSLLLNNLPDNRFSIALKLSSVNFDLNYINRIIDIAREKEIKVPDQVFFGLIFGNIKGPLILEPKIYAIVSLKNEIKIIK